jgi:hypothetical protein
LLHELGHALGLAHPHDGGPAPDATLFPGVTAAFGDYGDYNHSDHPAAVRTLAEYELIICVGCASIDWASKIWRDSLEKRPE